jgi:hypothetical protein
MYSEANQTDTIHKNKENSKIVRGATLQNYLLAVAPAINKKQGGGEDKR